MAWHFGPWAASGFFSIARLEKCFPPKREIHEIASLVSLKIYDNLILKLNLFAVRDKKENQQTN